MLLGEHAVLNGRRALVCAIDRRMTVEVSPTPEKTVRIVSDLGTYESPLDTIDDHPDFRFVLDAVRQYPQEQGIELNITSDFSSDIGLGSSAAVTVATHAALLGHPENKTDLFKRGLATIHRVQGRGSGTDVAASVFGGIVAYRAEPLEIHQIEQAAGLSEKSGGSFTLPLTAVYSGSKMKTADVIRLVEERRALNPARYEKIFDRMDASVGEVIADFSSLGKNLILNQKLMENMGLCNDALGEILSFYKSLPTPGGGVGAVPAKISGSGLGDCVVGLGRVVQVGPFKTYSLNGTAEGCVK